MEFDPISYLYNLQHFGVKLGLERMQKLMEVLGHPHKAFDSVHVAGTNGKGSTCAMLDSVLRASGRKVGFYSSPHLVDFCERIRVDGQKISVEELREIVLEIKAKLDAYDSLALSESEKFGEITFFEFTTAAAFVYFAKCGVDVAVIEVGLGGRLDATNVITPLVSVITNIDFDHTKVLGDTREAIAHEKAGVIKSGVPLVTGEKNDCIRDLFEKRCHKLGSTLFYAFEGLDFKHIDPGLGHTSFTWNSKRYKVALLGRHQAFNASVVLSVCSVLNGLGFTIDEVDIIKGLQDVVWRARLQRYSTYPLVYFDGAHNFAGMRVLSDFIFTHKNYLPKKRVCLLGFSTGKDAVSLLSRLERSFSHIIVTEAGHRAQSKEEVGAAAKKLGSFEQVEVLDLKEGWKRAIELVGKDGMVLVCGSLYLIGDLLKLLEETDVLGDSQTLSLRGANM